MRQIAAGALRLALLNFEDAEIVFFGPCVSFVDDRFEFSEECLLVLEQKIQFSV